MKKTLLILFFLALEETESFQGVFWHVCDVHLNKSYNSSESAYFGDYKSDSPFTLIQSAFKTMKNIYPNPDFILLNGDNVYHKAINNSDFEDSIMTVSNELWNSFPHSDILPSLGNHDVNPANLLDVKSLWCQNIYKKWNKYLKSNEKETFEKGCYYSRQIRSKNTTINVIILNTILWYSVNSHVKNTKDPLDQFNWLKNELQRSRNNKTKVFIVGHVPPGASEYSPNKFRHFHPEFNALFLKIMQSYEDIIDAGFFSHQHTDSFKIVYKNDKPVIPLLLSPSISPYYLQGLGSVNPSFRLYHWGDKSTQRRYEQYNANLHKHNSNILNWSLEYNSTSLLPGLSAHHFNELVSDFSKEDSKHFATFFNYHLSGQPHDNPDCSENSSCRCNIVCGICNIDYTNLDICLKNCLNKPVSQWVMIASVIIIFTIVLIGIVIGANKVYCRGRRTASLTRDIYLASYNGKNCEDIMSEHIDNIAENTFCDVPEYRGHIRNNSRTILTLNDGNEIVEKSQPSFSKFAVQSKNKSQEKYDYTRM